MNSAKNLSSYLNSRNLLILFTSVAGIATAWVLAQAPPLVALTLPIIVCSFWLMQKGAGAFSLRTLTIPGFCYLVYLGVILIPSFFVYANHGDPFRRTYLFAVESALLTLPLGVLFANRVFSFGRGETGAYFARPVTQSVTDPGPEVYFLFLVLAWVITFLYLLEVRTIPLFYMLAHPGEGEVLTRLREESLKLLDSPLRYVYSLLTTVLYRLLMVYGFGKYLQTRRSSWGLLFLASCLSGLLFAGFTIAKAPVAVGCVMLCFCFYLHRRGRAGAKFVLFLVGSVLAFPLFVLLREYKGTDLMAPLQGIGQRIFYDPAEVLYYWFEVFPHVVPYQYGMTIGKLAMLMGRQPFDASNVVGRYMLPRTIWSVSANAAFLGNFNADFGLAGVLVGGFAAGALLAGAQVYLVRRPKTILNLAIYAMFLYEFQEINATALPVVLLSGGPIFVVLLSWTMTTLESVMARALRIRRCPSLLGRPVLGPFPRIQRLRTSTKQVRS